MYFNIQYSYTHSKLSHQKEWPFRVLFLALPVVGANNSSGTPELKMMLFCAPPEGLLREVSLRTAREVVPQMFPYINTSFPISTMGKVSASHSVSSSS